MRTVLYLEYKRNQKQFLSILLLPNMIMISLFVAGIVLDRFFPTINSDYMKWPDMVRELLGINIWSSHLWFNLWQLWIIIYSFYLIFALMNGIIITIGDEERLETSVYILNAGINKETLLTGKLLLWSVIAFGCCAVQFVLVWLFMILTGTNQSVIVALEYYGKLFGGVLIFYGIAALIGTCKNCDKELLSNLLVFSWIIAKVPAFLNFFGALLQSTGREGAIIEQLETVAKKTEFLQAISPIVWCMPTVQITTLQIACSVAVMLITGCIAYIFYKGRVY